VGGGAPAFLQFIETELMPFVNKTYRTHDFKVIAGASAGGVFALYALQARPGLFQGHIAYSPAVWWNYGASGNSIKSYFAKTKELDSYVYINIGEEGGIMRERYDDMVNFLTANTPKGLTLVTEKYDGVAHGLTSGAGAFNAYQKLFLRKQMPLSYYTGTTDSITEYYQRVSAQYGEQIKPQEAVIRQMGYHYLSNGQFEQAIALFQFDVEQYPDSAEAHNGLAYGYEESGQYKASLASVEKALSLATSESSGYVFFKERKQRLIELLKK
jgi:tetratricopeptide (TPR) repeat protein